MTNPITDAELAEWERIERAATPGPWEAARYRDLENCLNGPDGETLVCFQEGEFFERHDAEATAAARNAFPRLLAEVRRLRQMLTEAGISPDPPQETMAQWSARMRQRDD